MPTSREDRRRGKQLPSPVTPPDTVCFKITIPSATPYRAALLGVIGQLSQWYTWDHEIDGTDCEDCEEAAQLWAVALSGATFSDECEEAMACEDVADCIENNEAVQDAIVDQLATNDEAQTVIRNIIQNSSTITQNTYNTAVQGTPMTTAQLNQGITSVPDCDPDVLFAEVTAIVNQLLTNNLDFLQLWELGASARDRVARVIAAIPLIETLPVDDIIAFSGKLQTEIKTNYEAQQTTALVDEYRCELFCLLKDRASCELTMQDLYDYWDNRLGAALDPLNLFSSLAQYFLSGTWAGTLVVDIMTFIQIGVWKEASNWTGISLRTLQTVGLLAADDPDPDWTIICDDCNDEVVVCGDYFITGTVISNPANGEYIVQANASGLIEWQNPACCVLLQIPSAVDGYTGLSGAGMNDCAGNPAGFGSLPLSISYVACAGATTMRLLFKFGNLP